MPTSSETQKQSGNNHGYALFILALTIGLLINISADIIYELFLRNDLSAQYIVLGLTGLCFVGLVYTYHSKFHEPLAKFLEEFE